MKKLLFLILICATLSTTLNASTLTRTKYNGTKTYCYYSDGEVLIYDGMEVCPAII